MEPPIDPQKRREYEEYARNAANPSVIQRKTQQDLEEQRAIMKETGPYLTLGIQMVLTVGVFFAIGYFLDAHFGTKPLWTAVITTVGAIASLTYFIVTVIRLSGKTETKRP